MHGICRYARAAAAGCNSPSALVRPPPPLTRYKKELAIKAQAGKGMHKCVLHACCLSMCLT